VKKALLIVDVQWDFLPGGALGISEAHSVARDISHQAREGHYEAIVASQDWHPKKHCSFASSRGETPAFLDKSWPDHCVANTQGAELDRDIVETLAWAHASGLLTAKVQKGQFTDHEAYSPFDEKAYLWDEDGKLFKRGTLAEWLTRNNVTDVEVCGLATDYCVNAAVLDSQTAGFNTALLLDLTLPVDVHSGMRCVADMTRAGVMIV
jgi:nicotinamidase/pyrazinamidase